MATQSKREIEAQKRKRDIAGSLASAAVSLVTTFLYTNAIVATLSLALAVYFLLDWWLTFAKKPWLSRAARVRFQLVFTTAIVMLVWHFYFENQYHEQRAAAVEGVLTPEKTALNKEAIILAADDGPTFSFTSDSSGPSSLPPGVYRPELQVRKGPAGVLLTTSVKDREGHQVVAIKDNHWIVYPPYSSDKNYTSTPTAWRGISKGTGAGMGSPALF